MSVKLGYLTCTVTSWGAEVNKVRREGSVPEIQYFGPARIKNFSVSSLFSFKNRVYFIARGK